MIELVKFFRILFLSSKISRERLKDFTESHLLRLAANNTGGVFTSILGSTTSKYNAFSGDLSSEAVNEAVKEGKTKGMELAREELLLTISENKGLVDYTYRLPVNRPKFEEFYPQGVEEYNDADLPTLETISLRYKTVLASHSADFPDDMVTEYNTKQGTYQTNRNAQTTAKGAVSADRSEIVVSKFDLAKQLTVNVLTIALNFVGDESKADIYFDQSILNVAFAEADRQVANVIENTVTHNVFDNVTADITFLWENTGESDVYIGFKDDENAVCTTSDYKLEKNKPKSYHTAVALGWSPDKKFLQVTNLGGATGEYSVKKV